MAERWEELDQGIEAPCEFDHHRLFDAALTSLQTRNTRKVNGERSQRSLQRATQLLEQLIHGLSGTITAWERFKESDLAYFDLDSDDAAAMVRNIDSSIKDCRALEATLKRQTEVFKSLTSMVSPTFLFTLISFNENAILTPIAIQHHLLGTIHSHTKTNALLTVALAFLPFTLTALLSSAMNTPPLATPLAPSAVSTAVTAATIARYLLASAWVACLAAVLYFAILHWSEAVERAEGCVEGVKGWIRGSTRKGKLGGVADRKEVSDGQGGSIWGGGWWGRGNGSAGKSGSGDYLSYGDGRLVERGDGEESDADGAAHGLPF